eukprot:14766128-Alexandrium_andersonii.AAC.1
MEERATGRARDPGWGAGGQGPVPVARGPPRRRRLTAGTPAACPEGPTARTSRAILGRAQRAIGDQ